MSNNENKDKLTDHDYDGIQELDNDLPRWWLMLFYVCIAYGAVYYAYYELGDGPSQQQEFEADLAAIDARKAASGAAVVFPDDAKLASFEKDAKAVTDGRGVFATRCASCHGDKGQGLIGPNLTDNFWLHGDGKLKAIAQTIYTGVPEKGMPPWGSMLKEQEVYSVATYVRSLRGTNPPNPKAPQGAEYK